MEYAGLEDPATYFDEKNDEGNAALSARRDENRRKNQKESRPQKTFKAIEASKMIGMSKSWLLKTDPDVPRDAQNHGIWDLERIEWLREVAGTAYKRPEGSEPFIMAWAKLKGGVGNTTAAVHAAHYMAMMGLKILFVDLDPQATATAALGGYNPDLELEEEDLPIHPLLDEPEAFKYCVKETYFHNVFLVPASGMLRNLEVDLQFQSLEAHKFPKDSSGNPVPAHDRLRAALEDIADDFDVIIIDCPPKIDLMTMNALGAANSLINVLKPSGADVASYSMLMGSLATYYDRFPKPLRYFRVLLSQFKEDGGSLKEEAFLKNWVGNYMMMNKIKHNAEISRSIGVLHSVFSLYKPESSRQAYNLGRETMESTLNEMLSDMKAIWAQEAGEEE